MTRHDSQFSQLPAETLFTRDEVAAAELELAQMSRVQQTTGSIDGTTFVSGVYSSNRRIRPIGNVLLLASAVPLLYYGPSLVQKAMAENQPDVNSKTAVAGLNTEQDKDVSKSTPSTNTEVTPADTATATIVPSESAPVFTSAVIGCVPAAEVAVTAEVGVKWIGTYEKTGEMFATNSRNFVGQVAGSLATDACLNTDTITFDQVLTDQNAGVATYTYDTATLRLTTNASGIQNSIRMYERADVLDSIRQDYKDARSDDAEHLLQTIREKANAIFKINEYFMYKKLDNKSTIDPLIAAGQTAIQTAYTNLAVSQGIEAAAIQFVPRNAPTADVLSADVASYPELAGKCDNFTPGEPRYTCYVYQPETANWQLQVNPPSTGVAQ